MSGRYRERETQQHEPEYDFLAVKVVRLSKKAALCELSDYDSERVWIPFSVMEDEGRDLSVNDDVDLSVETWFLKKNDIEID